MSTDYAFTVDVTEAGKTVQRVLQGRFRLSRRMIRRLKMTAGVTVNDRVVFLTSRVDAGDRVTMFFPEETPDHIEPEPIPLDILHEDEDLLVLNKQPGIVVHPTKHYQNGTLANGLVCHWQQRGESYLVRPVNRLDKDTSGVIVFAKHAYAHDFLSRQLHRESSVRLYHAIVCGRLARDRGTISSPIARDPDRPSHRMVTVEGKQAVTHYQVLARFREASYVACRLETGRTHQIRVHLAHIGHPIIADTMYGEEHQALYGMNRQALHAVHLRLTHPRTHKIETYQAPLASDIQDCLTQCDSSN